MTEFDYEANNLGRWRDNQLMLRALMILHRMATEQTGWRRYLSRWYYSDEPLRNDAANLIKEAGFSMELPDNTRLLDSGGPSLCLACGKYHADPPSRLCPGCQAYQKHQR